MSTPRSSSISAVQLDSWIVCIEQLDWLSHQAKSAVGYLDAAIEAVVNLLTHVQHLCNRHSGHDNLIVIQVTCLVPGHPHLNRQLQPFSDTTLQIIVCQTKTGVLSSS